MVEDETMSEPTWKEIPWDEVKQQPPDDWLDCSIGSVLCVCGGWVGMLMGDGGEQTCDQCGRRHYLRVTVMVEARE